MSSVASLIAVMDRTKIRGMAVVNQDREDTCGIHCEDESWLEDTRVSQRAETRAGTNAPEG